MASRKAEAEPLAFAGSPLPEEELAALLRVLRWARGFVLVFVRSNVPLESRQIVAELAERLAGDGPRVRELRLAAATDDLLSEIRALTPPLAAGEAVVVVGFEHSIPSRISYPPALDRLNRAREHFRELPCTLVLVLPDYALNQLAREAPDFWAWRSGVFATRPAVSRVLIEPRELGSRQSDLWSLALERKKDHLEVLQELLADLERSAVGNEVEKSDLCWRISVLHHSLGELDDSLLYARKALKHAGEDARGRALALGQIADIYQDRGELDEALRIRQEESLPIFEKLGDARLRAITLGQIADVFEARGELDEALRIRQEESLPIFEKLGDVRERAITLGQIADVYQARGELDEALRIRQEESLPVFERLGDQREKALTLWRIALIELQRLDVRSAVKRMSEVYRIFLRLGTPDGIAVLGLDLARIHLYVGLTEEAQVLLVRSRDAFAKLGWTAKLEETEALLAQVPNAEGDE